MLLELALETLEERERIGSPTREAGDDPVMIEAAHLAGIALEDAVAQGHLSVATDGHGSAAARGNDGSAGELLHC